jgi:hypothetical protein
MDPRTRSRVLLSAAGFNWLVGFGLLVNASMLFDLFGIEPVPDGSILVHVAAALIFAFGVGYHWAARDFATARPLVAIGALGKGLVVAVALVDVVLGLISWQALLLVSVDLVYALLFLQMLRQTRSVPA